MSIRKAIIPAAGHGTRLYPASSSVQKELFALVDVDAVAKPALQIIAEECVASGIEEICVVANPTNAEAIRRHFSVPTAAMMATLRGKDGALEQARALGALAKRVTVVVQQEQKGFGHAVFQARSWAAGEPVLVLLGDHVYLAPEKRCARQVIDVFDRYNAPVSALTVIPEIELSSMGVIAGEAIADGVYRVERLIEKPSVAEAEASFRVDGLPPGRYLAFFGIHAFPPSVFDALATLIERDETRLGEYQLTSAQEILVASEPRYVACRVNGMRLDMGVPAGLVRTQIALALSSPLAGQVRSALDELERVRRRSE